MSLLIPKIFKWPIRIAAVVVLLVVVTLVIVFLKTDSIARYTVESSGSSATGQSTKTDSVHVSLFTGNVGVHELAVANITGYPAKNIFHSKSISVDAELRSLFTDTLRIPKLEIKGLELNMEQQGLKNNVSQLLEQIKKSAGSKPPDPHAKKLQIDQIVIRDITAHVQVIPSGGKTSTLDVKVPELVLDNVTPDNASAAATPEVIRRIIPAVLAAVLDKGKGILPNDLVAGIGKNLGETVFALGGEASKLVDQAADDLTGTILKNVPGAAGKTAEDGLKSVGEGLKGILDRKKKDPAPR